MNTKTSEPYSLKTECRTVWVDIPFDPYLSSLQFTKEFEFRVHCNSGLGQW